MNKFFSKLVAPLEIIKIIKKHEPLYLLYALPQIFLNAILPILYVYFPKLIIEQLTKDYSYEDILYTIIIFIGTLLFINVLNTYLKNKSSLKAETFSKKLKYEIGNISMNLELKDIDDPASQDMIQMANKAAELTKSMDLVQNIISNIITIAGLIYIVVSLDWLFVLLLFSTLTIKIVFVIIQFNKNKKLRKIQAENDRYILYLFNLSFLNEGGAKEIRLNNLQNWYMDKNKDYRNVMVTTQYKSFRLYAIHNIITEIFVAIQSFIILWLLVVRFNNGIINIAEFTMYFSAATALTLNLSSVTEHIGNYSQQILNASDYRKIVSLLNIKKSEDSNNQPIKQENIEIIFHNVSFTYPNTDKQILDNINIKISNKEKLVIVGTNGAGKTTFIKLLCKFYHPTSGTITINGIDIWDIPNEVYYKMISAVFKDFTNFSFSLKENISMNDDENNNNKILDVINSLKLKDRVDELPYGYDTYLSKNFDSNGIEFSGGQSQKIAIARALYKDTPVLILDEPTASLDPKAESEIYTDFFNIAEDKTTIFISHRLAASTIADNIAVFLDGKIIEYGSHDYLINIKGVYYEMYQKQSSQYLDDKEIF